MSEKRYQVFISSTFLDLTNERQSALRAVLEINHMPAGMELFPAGDDAAWQLIRDVIDSSDYYLLIIGGRYGSTDNDGIGFTEKEYDYAKASKKPVVPLLHKSPETLPRARTEDDPAAWEKLTRFRKKIEAAHTCVYWTTADELKAQIIVGLTSAIKRHPAIGWVRADEVPSDTTLKDVLAMRQRITELEHDLTSARTAPPPGSDTLMQGQDVIQFRCTFQTFKTTWVTFNYLASTTWDDIFRAVAPSMINEASDEEFEDALESHLEKEARDQLIAEDSIKGLKLERFKFLRHTLDTCKVQLRALGLMRQSDKKRAIKDTATYWTLTPYGDARMVQLIALHKEVDAPVSDNSCAPPEPNESQNDQLSPEGITE